HCCPVDGLGTRLCPCGIATTTPQTFTVASGPRLWRPSPEFPARDRRTGARREPARIRRVRAGGTLRGVTQPVPVVYLPVSLTAPGPSGSPGPTRLCRGCSHPPRRPPAQAASSFTPPLRRRGDGRSLTSIRNSSASWRAHIRATHREPWQLVTATHGQLAAQTRGYTHAGQPAPALPNFHAGQEGSIP